MDEHLFLNDEQRERVMQEVFDLNTLAGCMLAERMAEKGQQLEAKPSDFGLDNPRTKQADTLADMIFANYLSSKSKPRVLVMGRIARPLCRRLAWNGCNVVLGETTLERVNTADNGLENVEVVLLPAPHGVEHDVVLASQQHFDLVIAAEPL